MADTEKHSAQHGKAIEVQRAGSAKAGAGQDVVTEGGRAEAPTEGKGHPKPAASRADAEGSTEAGTSSATSSKAEQVAAEQAAADKEQHGRGRRKAEG